MSSTSLVELTPQQAQALAAIQHWYSSDEDQVFFLAGYAGTGKTTIAQQIIAKLGAKDVAVAAYTGKAAQVLRRRGFPEAGTIHGLIYMPAERSKLKLKELEALVAIQNDPLQYPDGPDIRAMRLLTRQIKTEKEKLGQPAFFLDMESRAKDMDLIVIDECSMVDERIGEDLLSYGVKVLVIGDPGQLPPVRGVGYFTSGDPDFKLEEIHRQAADNPIIKMATKIRAGEELPFGRYGHSRIMARRRLSVDDEYKLISGADQVLVGYHRTRNRINNLMRHKSGFKNQLPVKGDKLVCLRNNHDIGILNGSLWRVLESAVADADTVMLHLKADDEERTIDLMAHNKIFMGQKMDYTERLEGVQDFDYGYALTVHKAQGSQWPNVVLYDEWDFNDRDKWLYTAVTRAEVKIDILR